MKSTFVVLLLIVCSCMLTASAANAVQETTPAGDGDKVHPSQISGIVVDRSGALMPQTTVEVWGTDGTVKGRTQTDGNGTFLLACLTPGAYRVVVSKTDFETKETFVNIGSTHSSSPLRISLTVIAVSTTISVQGREDDLVGIANSATQEQ